LVTVLFLRALQKHFSIDYKSIKNKNIISLKMVIKNALTYSIPSYPWSDIFSPVFL